MKNIIFCLVISFGTLQAFEKDDSSSEETLEEFDDILEDLSNPWSSEEKSDEWKESKQDKLSESSQVSKLEGTFGVNTEIEKEEEMKNAIITDDKQSESRQEPGNVIWTYVLWRPSVLDNSGILQSEMNYFNYIKDLLEGRIQNAEEKDEDRQGWRDDREQLDLPRVAALTSDDEPDLYDNIADTFNNLKENLNEVVARPEVKDNLFYVLMGLTGFLMLALVNDNLLKKQKPRTVQDHYLLPDTGASAKLPSYDECIKADKYLLVNIGENEVFNKVDLSLPVLEVASEKEERQK